MGEAGGIVAQSESISVYACLYSCAQGRIPEIDNILPDVYFQVR